VIDNLSHILLVDDEEDITANLFPFLERSGFRVSVAADGEEALHKVQENQPDLVVMDVLMPKMNGREALRRLRLKKDWPPVILLTQVGESIEGKKRRLYAGSNSDCALRPAMA
jgi:DNA-binding response OmpR family regulator